MSRRIFRHAVRATVAVAALSLAVLIEPVQAQGTPSAAQELADLRARAEAGDADAQTNLGVMYANGDGVPEDYTEAAAWYRKAAEQGHADAQFTLGQMYFTGDDHAEASTWYRRAAEQDHVEAQYMLGWMYHFGYMGNASP